MMDGTTPGPRAFKTLASFFGMPTNSLPWRASSSTTRRAVSPTLAASGLQVSPPAFLAVASSGLISQETKVATLGRMEHSVWAFKVRYEPHLQLLQSHSSRQQEHLLLSSETRRLESSLNGPSSPSTARRLTTPHTWILPLQAPDNGTSRPPSLLEDTTSTSPTWLGPPWISWSSPSGRIPHYLEKR